MMVRISKKSLECKLDLEYGNQDWMYTAHLFPIDNVPFDIVEPIAKKMMQKEGNTNYFHQAPQHLDLWVPKSQDKEYDPIDPLYIGQQPHGGCEGT